LGLVQAFRSDTGTRTLQSPQVQTAPGEVSTVSRQVDIAAAKLVQVEHALRLGGHVDLRSQLDHEDRRALFEYISATITMAGAGKVGGHVRQSFQHEWFPARDL
jgi:hypothetical protein